MRQQALFDDPSLPGEHGAWLPSEFQRAIFDDARRGSGHVAIRARAGCGKSTTILRSLEHVPRGKTALFLAFNKSIATELGARLPKSRLFSVSTLHSLGYATCRRSLGAFEVEPGKVKRLLRRLHPGASSEAREHRTRLGKAVSQAKNALADDVASVAQVVQRFGLEPLSGGPSVLAGLCSEVLDILALCARETGSIDYDDMIWLPLRLELPVWQKDRVLVDEAQDLNPAQMATLPRLVAPGGRIVVIGDNRQAIYQFRGAAEDAFDTLASSLDARMFPLSETYRCPQRVVALAQQFVPDLRALPGAPEGQICQHDTLDPRALEPGDFVLSRTKAPLLRHALRALALGLPVAIAGMDVVGRVRDILEQAEEGAGRRGQSIPVWLTGWLDRQVRTHAELDEDGSDAVEMFAAVTTLLEQLGSARQVIETLERVSTDTELAGKVVFSTTHKAKGLERDRVWLLRDTYLQSRGGEAPSVAEENLFYVAITRTKRELHLVGAS